jgi:ribokinase
VDVSGVESSSSEPSFVAFILVDENDGSRTIFSAPPNRPLVRVDSRPLPERLPHLVLVDGWGGEHQRAACRAACEAGIPVVLDAGSYRAETVALLELADVVIASEPFADGYVGPGRADDAVLRLLREGVRMAAITLGEKGAVAGAAGSEVLFEVPARRIRVVDTTGAGDAFHAGTACGLVEGRTWEESLEIGSAVASRKCGRLGARAGLPRRVELARDGLTG